MKCSKCGIETEEDFSFCPNCGSPAESPLGTQPYTYPITAMLKDTLFLVICILMSAATVFSFVGGSIPIIATLETVFLWIIYARMRTNGTPDPQSMRWLSGTIFASYIVNWVVVGLIAVTGVLSSMVLGYIVNNYWLFEEYFGRMSESVFSIISASSGFLMVAMLAVAAFVAVINYFSTRSFHKLAKSMYESVERGTVRASASRQGAHVVNGCRCSQRNRCTYVACIRRLGVVLRLRMCRRIKRSCVCAARQIFYRLRQIISSPCGEFPKNKEQVQGVCLALAFCTVSFAGSSVTSARPRNIRCISCSICCNSGCSICYSSVCSTFRSFCRRCSK